MEGQHQEAVECAQKLRQTGQVWLQQPVFAAILNVWEASSLTVLNKYREAREKFDAAIATISAITEQSQEAAEPSSRWYVKAALALAYRWRGYLNRETGFISQAVDDYRRAVALWRQVEMRAELAATLNEMAHALSEEGYWEDARSLAEEALTIRRWLGPRLMVSLSLRTLADIYLHDGDYDFAITYAKRALSIARAMSARRTTGRALVTLAEALRRSIVTLTLPADCIARLREAYACASEAAEIFKSMEEPALQVSALIEMGCAQRDWATLRRQYPDPADNTELLITGSYQALEQAAQVSPILYRRLDALVNIGWLWFYSQRDELYQQAVAAIRQVIPPEFYFDKNTGWPSVAREHIQCMVWMQLGKFYVLQGHFAFRSYARCHGDRLTDEARKYLLEAVEHYTLGLQYSSLYSDAHPTIRNAKDQIYERLSKLPRDHLKMITDKVAELEAEYKLGDAASWRSGSTQAFQPGKSTMWNFIMRRALWYV